MSTYRLALASLRLLRWRLGLSRTGRSHATPSSWVATRHARLATLLLVFALPLHLGLSGCSSDDAPNGEPGSGATGGAGGTGASGGSGGSGSGGTGSGGTTGPASGGSGGSPTAASTSGGGEGGGPPESIDFCGRLTGTSVLAGNVAFEYELRSSYDCRVWNVANLYINTDARDVFLNDLMRFNLELWGCAPAPTQFDLVYWDGLSLNAPRITSADAEVLIEDYLAVATPMLSLSGAEVDALTATLRWLASARVLESSELSRSTCEDSGAGGAAGAAGGAGSPN